MTITGTSATVGAEILRDKTIYKMVSSKIEYIIMLVQLFARHYGMSFTEAYRYISRYGGIEYTEQHYNILHTLSFDDQVDGLAHFCYQKGGNLL